MSLQSENSSDNPSAGLVGAGLGQVPLGTGILHHCSSHQPECPFCREGNNIQWEHKGTSAWHLRGAVSLESKPEHWESVFCAKAQKGSTGWSCWGRGKTEGIQTDIKKIPPLFQTLSWEEIKKSLRLCFPPHVKILCILSHSNIFSTWLHCFPSAWVLVYLKVNGILGWKERRGKKKGKKGEKNPGTDFEIQILFSDWFFSLFAQLLFTAALLAQTNLNSLQNKMTGRWKDNVCLNIIDQPLSWHSQHGENVLYTASFNHLRQGFSSCLSITRREDLPPVVSSSDGQVNY